MELVARRTRFKLSRERLAQLFDVAEQAGLGDLYDAAATTLSRLIRASPMADPGAWFERILTNDLRKRGVDVRSGADVDESADAADHGVASPTQADRARAGPGPPTLMRIDTRR